MASLLLSKTYTENNSALHIACYFDNSWRTISHIAESGGNIDARNQYNQTPLHVAVFSNDIVNVRHILRLGAGINAVDNDGKTPLMYAISSHSMTIVSILLRRGSDISIKDNECDSAIHYAIQVSDMQLIEDLLQINSNTLNDINKNGFTPLMIAVQRNNSILIKLLLSYGANPSWRNVHGNSAVLIALKSKNDKIINIVQKSQENTDRISSIRSSRRRYLMT